MNCPKYQEDLKNAGNLFIDESKEYLEVTKETYLEVLRRAGGYYPFIVMACIMIFEHFFNTAQQYDRYEWGQEDFET